MELFSLQYCHFSIPIFQVSQPKTSAKIHDPSTSVTQEVDGSAKTYGSVLISDPPSRLIQDRRLLINDEFHQRKPSVFERLGSGKPDDQKYISGSHKRNNVEPIKPAKRLSVDTSIPKYGTSLQ